MIIKLPTVVVSYPSLLRLSPDLVVLVEGYRTKGCCLYTGRDVSLSTPEVLSIVVFLIHSKVCKDKTCCSTTCRTWLMRSLGTKYLGIYEKWYPLGIGSCKTISVKFLFQRRRIVYSEQKVGSQVYCVNNLDHLAEKRREPSTGFISFTHK